MVDKSAIWVDRTTYEKIIEQLKQCGKIAIEAKGYGLIVLKEV